MYLILGGTGKTGRKIVQNLSNLKLPFRVGSRQAEIPFSWDDRSNWPKLLRGVKSIYITYQPDLAVPGALEAIEELVAIAQLQKVEHLVLLSGKGEREAELCEQVVMHSGIDYTILRASWFNQNFSESFFLGPILEGKVALPMAQAKVPYVDTDDIAGVATKVLTEAQHRQKLYELTGPDLWTFEEVIQSIAKASQREIEFTPISIPAYISIMEQQEVPKDFIWLIQYLFTEVLYAPGNDEISTDIEKVLGRPAKSFQSFVRETAAQGVWNP